MRLKRSRIETFYHRARTTTKDAEGCTTEVYGDAIAVTGEAWPASGQVQAQEYGHDLGYVYNMRLTEKYSCASDDKGNRHYTLAESGAVISELDGICLHVGADEEPDYRIRSIKPYRFLTMELERVK